MPAIINHGPALEIIHLIANKKINNKKKLRKFFLKSKVSRAVEKRLNINISSNLIKFDKEGLFITKNTKKIDFITIFIFNFPMSSPLAFKALKIPIENVLYVVQVSFC